MLRPKDDEGGGGDGCFCDEIDGRVILQEGCGDEEGAFQVGELCERVYGVEIRGNARDMSGFFNACGFRFISACDDEGGVHGVDSLTSEKPNADTVALLR